MVPVAPALLSTMKVCPKVLVNDGPIARAIESVEPPGGNGTSSVTGFDGHVSACAVPTAAAATRPRARLVNKLLIIRCLLEFSNVTIVLLGNLQRPRFEISAPSAST